MRAFSDDPGRLPSQEQLLIIQAALLPGAAGEAAGTDWLAQADIDRLGKASRRLLPLLYQRFSKEGREHPILPVLKGVKRHTWYNNQRLLLSARQAVDALASAGIDRMIIKGGAMTLHYYRDSSLRPMEDVDLMVRYQDAAGAIEALRRTGFVPVDKWLEEQCFSEIARGYFHAAHFIHPNGQTLDLHWNLMPYALGPAADADFWAASGQINFHEHSVRILNPADQLLHICVHGATWDSLSPVRWIPDAVAVINHSPDLDWDRLLEQARKCRVTLMVTGALAYLHANLEGIVSSRTLSDFRNKKASVFETMEYHFLIVDSGSPLYTFKSIIFKYMRASHNSPFAERLYKFPGFLRSVFRVSRTRELPKEILRRTFSSWKRFLLRNRRTTPVNQARS